MQNPSPVDERLLGRIVVLSPHLDDAVLSLGATIARAVESGARVEVLTVFAGNPDSNAPTDDWERKTGFATAGEASRRRREEDRAACAVLGSIPRWFDYGPEPYERGASMAEVLSAVEAATAGADTILVPGFPLAHADHAALTQAVLVRGLSCQHLGLYAEQPYSFDRRAIPSGPVRAMPALVESATLPWQRAAADFTWQRAAGSYTWQRAAANSRHRHAKLQAVKQYQSQLRSLGLRQTGRGHLRLRMMLWSEARQGGETIAWPNAT
jgi:LmbE family N-acetylglucosaminyl deacetylase